MITYPHLAGMVESMIFLFASSPYVSSLEAMSFCWVKSFYLEEVFCLCLCATRLIDIPRILLKKPWFFSRSWYPERNLKILGFWFVMVYGFEGPMGWIKNHQLTSWGEFLTTTQEANLRGFQTFSLLMWFLSQTSKNPSTLGKTSSHPMSSWKIDVSSGQLTLFKLYRADEVRYMIYDIYIYTIRI